MRSNNKNKSLKTQESPIKIRKRVVPSFSQQKIKTLTSQSISHSKKHLRYDTTLFHKTIFHLKPLANNPEIFTEDQFFGPKVINILKEWRPLNSKLVLPHPIQMKVSLSELPNRQKMLKQITLSHLTAKKWIIYSMNEKSIVKGYKHQLQHYIASISKLMTFYTAYEIIKQYFISINTFQLLSVPEDHLVGGTKLSLNFTQQTLITLQQSLFALLLASSNNIALTIANNLGSYILKKKKGRYFSCFDIQNENRENNINIFVALMNKFAKQMGLVNTIFQNPHGLNHNKSSALDVARLASECFRIPLFAKITSRKSHTIRPRQINSQGELINRICLLQNTNILLEQGCLGGKTGYNALGGDSFVGCFEGGLMIVVLGCAGKQEKFQDCRRLYEWVSYKLMISQKLNMI